MHHNSCKASFTMSKELFDFISYYSKIHGGLSRSAVIQRAIELLRNEELAQAYKDANSEIDEAFDMCVGDGLNEQR